MGESGLNPESLRRAADITVENRWFLKDFPKLCLSLLLLLGSRPPCSGFGPRLKNLDLGPWPGFQGLYNVALEEENTNLYEINYTSMRGRIGNGRPVLK